jgi:hypothetical protein
LEGPAKEETLDEKVARVRREVEEIRVQQAKEKRPEIEIEEWESFAKTLSPDSNAMQLLSSRITKLSSPSQKSSNVYPLLYFSNSRRQLIP